MEIRRRSHFATCATIAMIPVTVIMESGCAKGTRGGQAPNQLVVGVAAVEQRDVPIYSEWIGTLDGYVTADIKAWQGSVAARGLSGTIHGPFFQQNCTPVGVRSIEHS